ncbi:uncharacterized protein [Lepisosteus oculatus]|uniref:uncharacterized protein n=1 Tax=Lepisosteus oculatus TaxID=7918 RepID=UPI0035F51757
MEDLIDFLRERDIPESTIEKMKEEKIDASVLMLMTDEQMRDYLPSYGDRLAVMGYCRRHEKEPNSRKSKLFDRLKSKLNKRKKCKHPENITHHQEVNTQRKVRKVELGWMLYDEGKGGFIQVRTKKGGGTRKLSVSKDWKKKDLITEAIRLFFPDGKNAHGNISEFEVDLTNYQEVSLDEDSTVGALYEASKLTIMRFYLSTKKKHDSGGVETQQESNTADHSQENTQDFPSTDSQIDPPLELETLDVIYVGNTGNDLNLGSDDVAQFYPADVTDDSSLAQQSSTIFTGENVEDSNIITIFNGDLSEMGEQSLEDTLPLAQELREPDKKILVVHRSQILSELIEHFTDERLSYTQSEIQVKLLLPNGQYENGYDDGGVLRDCLSEFWHEFYEQCTTGSTFKIPFLRHDYGKKKWQSIGKIISFGWQKQKYLPIKLAPVILEQAALGYVKSDLVDNFLKYVSESDRYTLECCRRDFNSSDQDELLEILDNYSCRRMPNAHNIEQILQELAHKTLIQEPAYVIEQWESVLAPLSKALEEIETVYENLQPTARKIIRSLKFPCTMNAQEKEISKHITTYLRECDGRKQSLFLRFCTGSDLFLGKTVTVDFTHMQGFERRPMAHTCGCYLRVSIHYDSYPDFRCEMNKILESNIWVMDIV